MWCATRRPNTLSPIIRLNRFGHCKVAAMPSFSASAISQPIVFVSRHPRGLGWMLAIALATATTIAPYVLILHSQSGNWMLTQKKSASLAMKRIAPSPLPAEVIDREPFLETVVRGSRVSGGAPLRCPSPPAGPSGFASRSPA